MSYKVSIFRVANIAPQPTCNYLIWIPSIITSPVAIETASVPFPEVESKTIPVRGIQYSIPVKKKAQGTWSCTMGESILMTSIYQSLFKMYNDMTKYDRLENENPMSTEDIAEIFSARLRNIYIFVTDGISGVIPMLTCILKNCYLTKINPLKLNAAGGAEAMNVELTFQYNDIVAGIDVKKIKNPIAITGINVAKLAGAYVGNKVIEELTK